MHDKDEQHRQRQEPGRKLGLADSTIQRTAKARIYLKAASRATPPEIQNTLIQFSIILEEKILSTYSWHQSCNKNHQN